ncbi:Unknown protein sequence [Pseudomonas syringae pv. maculicola str. M6]|nr:Unknown protein sequence [Pseudomonas syringae pv. maculicola str. M6]
MPGGRSKLFSSTMGVLPMASSIEFMFSYLKFKNKIKN